MTGDTLQFQLSALPTTTTTSQMTQQWKTTSYNNDNSVNNIELFIVLPYITTYTGQQSHAPHTYAHVLCIRKYPANSFRNDSVMRFCRVGSMLFIFQDKYQQFSPCLPRTTLRSEASQFIVAFLAEAEVGGCSSDSDKIARRI